MEIIIIILCLISIILSIITLAVVKKSNNIDSLKQNILYELDDSRREIISSTQTITKNMFDVLSASSQQSSTNQDRRLAELNNRLNAFSLENEQKLENIRRTVESRLNSMQEDNNKKLDQMRNVVDVKLQKTLDERLTQSFSLVSQRLEQVYKGLGEMQNLAVGVGDLKKVLSNVKSRGILGEIQLGAILEEILSPEQYETNVVTKKGSGKPVEYAVKLPGNDSGFVYLPIDAKFPGDTYAHLVDAYESADTAEIDAAGAALVRTLKSFAKDIRDKYVNPPETTDFGIMFLPFEGLYAEAVRRGLVETLQREYRITIAGPTTMAALLNSLQMGFKTLAIQKRSGEVWNVLGAVKTEFDKFADVLEATKKRLDQANDELDKLVGVRTRQIQSKLRSVTKLPEDNSAMLIDSLDNEQ